MLHISIHGLVAILAILRIIMVVDIPIIDHPTIGGLIMDDPTLEVMEDLMVMDDPILEVMGDLMVGDLMVITKVKKYLNIYKDIM